MLELLKVLCLMFLANYQVIFTKYIFLNNFLKTILIIKVLCISVKYS